jgi:hypothetical protein
MLLISPNGGVGRADARGGDGKRRGPRMNTAGLILGVTNTGLRRQQNHAGSFRPRKLAHFSSGMSAMAMKSSWEATKATSA